MNKVEHFYELDYIRALSAIFVVLYHYTTRYNEIFGNELKLIFELSWGALAVNTFFILSGYLTMINLCDNRILFLYKRFVRIFPTYWIAIIITSFFMGLLMPERLLSLKEILINFTMLQSIIGINSVDGVYWTLLFEVLFYFWVMVILLRRDTNTRIKFLYLWILIALFTIICKIIGIDNALITLVGKLLIVSRVHHFILGILIAMWVQRVDKIKLIFLCGLCLINAYLQQGLTVLIWMLVWGGLIWGVATGRLHFKMREKNIIHISLCFVATISYSLYLLHQNIGFAIIGKMKDMYIDIMIIIPIFISILIASVVHYLMAEPVRNLSKKIEKRL